MRANWSSVDGLASPLMAARTRSRSQAFEIIGQSAPEETKERVLAIANRTGPAEEIWLQAQRQVMLGTIEEMTMAQEAARQSRANKKSWWQFWKA
jgi:hypothetical protein